MAFILLAPGSRSRKHAGRDDCVDPQLLWELIQVLIVSDHMFECTLIAQAGILYSLHIASRRNLSGY